jgi:hypothetical protein
MKTVEDNRRANLAELIRELGTLEAVANAADTSPVYLSQIKNQAPDVKTGRPRQMGARMARRMEIAAHKPVGWMDAQHLSAGETLAAYAVAQDLSQSIEETAVTIPWEQPMTAPLPKQFKLTAPDEALAPRVRTGQSVEFDSQLQPRPGDGVLVQDAHGHWYLRIYKQGRPGTWEAHATHEAYQPMHSDRDQLSVLAVVVAVHARWT